MRPRFESFAITIDRATQPRSSIFFSPTRKAHAPPKALAISLSMLASVSFAADNPDQAREDMQRALNNEVAASPFNPGDIKKAEAYAEQAKKQNVVPVAVAPSYWAPGWTCSHLTAYRYYNYGDYRNCVYYHHYYGHYWR